MRGASPPRITLCCAIRTRASRRGSARCCAVRCGPASIRSGSPETRVPTAGIVYATEFTEIVGHPADAAVARADGPAHRARLPVERRPRRRGSADADGSAVRAVPALDYKTDWWSERTPVWLDGEPYEDARPFAAQLEVLLRAALERRAVVIDPFGAVVAQNKRLFAWMYDARRRRGGVKFFHQMACGDRAWRAR